MSEWHRASHRRMPPSDKLSSSSTPDQEGAWRTTEDSRRNSRLFSKRELFTLSASLHCGPLRNPNLNFALGLFRPPQPACPDVGNNAARGCRVSCLWHQDATIRIRSSLALRSMPSLGHVSGWHARFIDTAAALRHKTPTRLDLRSPGSYTHIYVLDPGNDLHSRTS